MLFPHQTPVFDCKNREERLGRSCHVNKLIMSMAKKGEGSLVPSPRAPPGEKRSGQQSRISWDYSPKVVRTNEIARSVVIT